MLVIDDEVAHAAHKLSASGLKASHPADTLVSSHVEWEVGVRGGSAGGSNTGLSKLLVHAESNHRLGLDH